MENVNFNFASENDSYEGWNEYNEEREAEEFTNKKIEELRKAISASVWKTGQAVSWKQGATPRRRVNPLAVGGTTFSDRFTGQMDSRGHNTRGTAGENIPHETNR